MSVPFVEKYRPQEINDCILSEEDKNIFNSFIEKKSIPHLLFHGTPGLGKTTIAKILAKKITEDILYICASSETSVDVIRGKVANFCSTSAFGDNLKVVILDEFDYMSINSHATLRNVIEEFTESCRFIFTCNYINKVMDAIKSRTQMFKFTESSPKLVCKRCMDILKQENIKIKDINGLVSLVKKYHPDIRKTINEMERNCLNGVFDFIVSSNGVQENFLELVKTKQWNLIRSNIVGKLDYVELYKILFDNSATLSDTKYIMLRGIVAEYLYRHSIIIDPEINFMACLDAVMNEIE
jgi:DNA polymerase III delta prime subunit